MSKETIEIFMLATLEFLVTLGEQAEMQHHTTFVEGCGKMLLGQTNLLRPCQSCGTALQHPHREAVVT